MAASVFNARLAQAKSVFVIKTNLIAKTDFDTKLSSLNRKITVNKSKQLIVENELKKLYFIGKSHFDEDLNRYFKVIANTDYVSSWKSKGLSAETIKPRSTSDNNLNPAKSYYTTKTRVKFTGSCLQQPKASYTHGTIVNIYIVYELGASGSHSDDPMLENCLFSAVTLTGNANINKYGYSGYAIVFDRNKFFISKWWIWSKCNNLWQHEFFCSCW